MSQMECIVCFKPLEHGLIYEPHSRFCNTVCATFFARAVEHVVFLDGDNYRAIDNWLSQFMMVQKKRATVARKRTPKQKGGDAVREE